MAGTPIAPFDLPTITSIPETDSLMIFRDGGESDSTVLNFLTSARVIADANLTSVRLATLDASGILNLGQLPAGYDDSAPLGTWAIDNTDPVLSDAGGTTGDKYRIVADGTIAEGAGSLEIDGVSVQAGDLIVKGSSAWYIASKVSNHFDGSTDEDTAAALGDYYRTADVNDRTNARQVSNAVLLGNNGYLAPGVAYPGTNPIQDEFTAIVSVRFNSLPTSSDSSFAMLTLSGAQSSSSHGSMQIEVDGTIDFNHYDGGFNSLADILGGAVELGRVYRLAYRVDSANDGLTSFVDGVKGSSVATGAGTGTTLRWNLGTSDEDNGGTEILSFVHYNRVLSDAEIALEAVDQNVKVTDQWSDNSTQTSGTLTVGQKYRIDTYVSADDFTNVGAGSNATGVEFVATGTTPTTYSNGSTLRLIGCVVALLPENIESDGSIVDASSNELNATATNVTPLRTKPQVSGTWAPVLKFATQVTTRPTYTTQEAYWRKLDEKTVFVSARLLLSSKGDDTGNASISGLPFTSKNTTADTLAHAVRASAMTGLTGAIMAVQGNNNTTFDLHQYGATGTTIITNTVFTNTSHLQFSFVYEIE